MGSFDRLAANLQRGLELEKKLGKVIQPKVRPNSENHDFEDEALNEEKMYSDMDNKLSEFTNKIKYNNEIVEEAQTTHSNKKTKPYKGLPKAIYESLVDNPLDYSDEMDELFSNGKLIKEAEKKKKILKEDNIQSNQPIDYALIKMIIEDTVSKQIEKLQLKMLKENKSNNNLLTTMRLKNNKFNFLTANGDLYEAELKFIKNIRDKK